MNCGLRVFLHFLGAQLAIVLLGACGSSHVLTDEVDAAVEVSIDVSVDPEDDSGEPAYTGPSLILAKIEDGDTLTLADWPVGGEVRALPSVPLPSGSSFLSQLAMNHTGTHGVVLTRSRGSIEPISRVLRHSLIEWETGRTVHLEAATGDEVCERADRSEFHWRSDGEALYFTCQVRREMDVGTVALESRVFMVSLNGIASPLGRGCTRFVVATDDARAVLSSSETCDDVGTVSVWGSRETPIPLREREEVRYWWDGGVIASALRDHPLVGHENLSWVSPAGDRELLEADLGLGRILLAMSPEGAIPVAARTPEAIAIESVDVRWPSGEWTPTDVSECVDTSTGSPDLVRWTNDGRAMAISCRSGSWIMHRDGTVRSILPRSSADGPWDADFRWSADGGVLLRALYVDGFGDPPGYHLVDPVTGNSSTPRAFVDFAPVRLGWRLGSTTPGCGSLVECGF